MKKSELRKIIKEEVADIVVKRHMQEILIPAIKQSGAQLKMSREWLMSKNDLKLTNIVKNVSKTIKQLNALDLLVKKELPKFIEGRK